MGVADVQALPECGTGEALFSGPQFSHLQSGALDGHLYSRQLAAVVVPPEEEPILLSIQSQALHGKAAPSPGEPASPAVLRRRAAFWWRTSTEKTRLEAASAE